MGTETELFFKLNIQIKLFSRQTLHNKRTHSNSIRLNYRRGQQAQICACQQSTCCFLKEAKVNWSNRGETVPKLVLYGFTGVTWGFRTNFILDGTKKINILDYWNVLSANNVLSNPNNLMNRRSATSCLVFCSKEHGAWFTKGCCHRNYRCLLALIKRCPVPNRSVCLPTLPTHTTLHQLCFDMIFQSLMQLTITFLKIQIQVLYNLMTFVYLKSTTLNHHFLLQAKGCSYDCQYKQKKKIPHKKP